MSEYSICPGGSLKLKGGVAEGGIVKKKKKKGKRKKEIFTGDDPVEAPSSLFQGEGDEGHVPSSGRNSPSVSSGSSRKTEAEKRFQEAQKRRLGKRVAEFATKTHKDRVNEFNAHLESLSEHHDIPKVGPG